ncbi:hypothetical protein [Acaryochloris marina]|uniref:hypothetical protein n=1 Tax=Acaryochloris marina TaxID=155978 RepID=UPI001BB0C98A|nr:hypothetical protein [Acaryochloris marina]QUY45865.1 hypothetical protein I1H34_29455 [Acaryochloris marina S15]
MSQALVVQEIGISLAAKDLNPSALNPDFLKYSDIIPSDWELARPPVYTNQVVQIVFKNGLSLIAQPNRVDFVESVPTGQDRDSQVHKIAQQYVQKLPKVDYQGVSINARAHTKFANTSEAHRYLTTQLLTPGSWSDNEAGPVQAAIQMGFPQERGQLNLSINQAELKRSETESEAAILFSGNFNYELEGETPENRLNDVQQLIGRWDSCIQTFEKVVQRFVQSPTDLLIPMAEAV